MMTPVFQIPVSGCRYKRLLSLAKEFDDNDKTVNGPVAGAGDER